MRCVLLLLAVVSAQALAQGSATSGPAPDRDAVFWRGECVRIAGPTNDADNPCPPVPNYRGLTRAQVEAQKSAHALLIWNKGEPLQPDDVVLDQWPPKSQIGGWPRRYGVALFFSTREKTAPPEVPVVTCLKPEACEPPSIIYIDRTVRLPCKPEDCPVPPQAGVCPVGQACRGACPEPPRVCPLGESCKGECPAPPPEKTCPDPGVCPAPKTDPTPIVVGAGGVGTLGGYLISKLLQRRRRKEDEDDEERPAKPAAAMLNARVHPDRIGTQVIEAFRTRASGPGEAPEEAR